MKKLTVKDIKEVESKFIKISFGKLQSDGQKAFYLTDTQTKERVFGFWYDSVYDNPFKLTPTQAVTLIIKKAGFNDLRDYYEQQLIRKDWIEE